MTEHSKDILTAAGHLSDGKLVAIPTETVYGLAGNAFNEAAVKSIFSTKERPFYDPLILHTDTVDKIKAWGMQIPEALMPLTEAFWPGPLTLLIERSEMISDFVTAGLPRVAFRVPQHSLTLNLLAQLDFPLAAPSANPFGFVSPTQAAHVLQHFDGKIAMVLDGGPCEVGIESTIVGIEYNQVIVYRLGGLAIEDVEACVGPVELRTSSSRPDAPGMLIRHYAPNKPVFTVNSQTALEEKLKAYPNSACILYALSPPKAASENRISWLSTNQNANEAAARFYNTLRRLGDDDSIDAIIVERLPDFKLGRAINDRLKRASIG